MTLSANHIALSVIQASHEEAQTALEVADSSAQLIDVRTAQEWQHEALAPALTEQSHQIAWRTLPGMEKNPDFIAALKASVSDADAPLYFLCKGGVRSQEAAEAAIAAGFTACYNIIGGVDHAPAWKAGA